MKIFRLILILQLSIFCTFTSEAQDIHFTHYTMSPLDLNPSHTGKFEGTFRIGGIYRDQWFSFLSGAYRTPAVYIDAPIMKGFGKKTKDWIGLGVRVLNDQAGRGKLNNTNAMLSAAYHRSLDKKRTRIFSFGIQGGINQRRLDKNLDMSRNGLLFEDQIIDNFATTGQIVSTTENIADNISYYDFSAGVMYDGRINKTSGINFGVNVRHITTPNYSLDSTYINSDSDTTNSIPLRFLVHGEYDTQLSDKLTLNPRFLYQRMRTAQEFHVQALLHYLVNKQNDVSLNFGLGYRFGDAGEVLLGLDYKDFRFGAAYDINLSDLTAASNTVGAIEVGLSYIVKIFKKPVVKPVIICPKL